MRVTTVHPNELGPDEEGLWKSFQRSSPMTQSPFLSLTFARTVGRARRNARVAVIEESGKVVAFLPYELGPRGMGLPIGQPINDLQGFIGSTVSIDPRLVVRRAGLRGWRFEHAPVEQTCLTPYYYRDTTIHVPVIDMTGGYELYISGRSKSSTTKRILAQRRSLERQYGPVSLVWNSFSNDYLSQLVDWKSGKYYGAQKIFSDAPELLSILNELAVTDSDDCRGILSVLFAGDQAIALHLGLTGPTGLSAWMPSYDREFSRFSPGMMMWYALVEQAAAQGITRIDLGYGQHDYKFRIANESYGLAGGAVWSSRIEESARRAYRRYYYDRRHKPSPSNILAGQPAS